MTHIRRHFALRILLLLHNMILRQQVQGQKEQWGRLGSKTDWRKKNLLLRNLLRLPPPAGRIHLRLLRICRAETVRSHWKKKIRILLRWIGKKNRKKKEKEMKKKNVYPHPTSSFNKKQRCSREEEDDDDTQHQAQETLQKDE